MPSMGDDLGFQLFLAKLFGQKMEVSQENHKVIGYVWRGHMYVVEVRRLEQGK